MIATMVNFETSSSRLYVYIMENGIGHLKIGFSKDPEARAKNLQTANSMNLEIVYKLCHNEAPMLEQISHRILHSYRIQGEWFKCSRREAISAVETSLELLPLMIGLKSRPQDGKEVSYDKGEDPIKYLVFSDFLLGPPTSERSPTRALAGSENVKIPIDRILREALYEGPKTWKMLSEIAAEKGYRSNGSVLRSLRRIGAHHSPKKEFQGCTKWALS